RELEEALADFLGREAVLLCSSGWLANLAVVTALAGRGDRVVQDRLSHASLIDAARLSGARLQRYAHADANAAREILERGQTGRALLVTDGLFSMDGDRAPLDALVPAAADHDAWLVVDDAHGIGVLGDGGRGCVAGAGWSQHEVPVLVGTLGKALAAAGGFVAGSRVLIEHLVNEGRPYVYDTALPPPVAAAALAALQVLRGDPEPRQRLHANVQRFREGVRQLGLDAPVPEAPIQPLLLGDSQRALRVSEELRERGLWVTAIRPPTVPRGSARLRITLSAAHSDAQIDRLLAGLDTCARS
ncbi:MAG: 8-amino-7-oxononanoate synthase, partial [Xanthomonadales bacterium]|nr:8-amino-7-oxononanoate synthase [Xanthomonadales bacterium]